MNNSSLLWVFCCNDNAEHKQYAKHAVKSANNNTTLRKLFIYDGNDKSYINWMQANGVRVIQHRILFYDQYLTIINNQAETQIGSGAFLRLDIPIILKRLNYHDKYVLYTDCDVIFHHHPQIKINPTYFACCNEVDLNPSSEHFNSGVMYLNVNNMLFTYSNLITWLITNKFSNPTGDFFDQGALTTYYRGKWDHLDPIFNWKPYWGWNENAVIIHYHGPKTYHMKQLFTANAINLPVIYHQLIHRINNNISWQPYINSYNDLIAASIKTQEEANNHWTKHGIYEQRVYPNDKIVSTIKLFINLFEKYQP